ncbi:MAG: tryptophan synthase subunit alpha, partial [Candidatus Dormibacteraceae bacterium]
MTNKIDHQLSRIRSDSHTGIMTHVVVGYPTLDATEEIVRTMAAAGVDLVEMQIPFSDPLADGPTIQAACEAALTSGTRVRDAFVLAKRLQDIDIPLLFMAYFNTLYKYGVERFCQDAAAAGISGLIVPDAPFEAAIHEGFLDSCHKTDLYNIITLSPTSTPERLRKNAAIAQGFVYCVARQGVTGAGGQIYKDVASYLHNIREHIDLPLALGFGISDRVRFEAVA